jgi:hypothetical protein
MVDSKKIGGPLFLPGLAWYCSTYDLTPPSGRYLLEGTTYHAIHSRCCRHLSPRRHHRCTIVRCRPAPPPPSKPPSQPDPTLQSNEMRHIIMNPPMPSATARRSCAPRQPTALVAFVATGSLLAAAAVALLSGTIVVPSPSPRGASPLFFGGGGGHRHRRSRSCSRRRHRWDGG